jgi:hypothetical protein
MIECKVCREWMLTAAILNHVRLMHPDVEDVEPETWADGGVVWYDDAYDIE